MTTTPVTLSADMKVGVRPFYSDSGLPGRYSGNGNDYVTKFHKLARKWRIETAYISSTSEMFEHPAFAEIIKMGEVVVPLIIQELERQPDMLLGTLVFITGEDPITDDDRGNVYRMAVAWIDWFRRRNP